MVQTLKLIAALLAMFMIVPASILLATGSWRASWIAAREYGMWVLVICLVPAAIGCVIG
jgi:high-affinity K+ transport system ATPase subunit B